MVLGMLAKAEEVEGEVRVSMRGSSRGFLLVQSGCWTVEIGYFGADLQKYRCRLHWLVPVYAQVSQTSQASITHRSCKVLIFYEPRYCRQAPDFGSWTNDKSVNIG